MKEDLLRHRKSCRVREKVTREVGHQVQREKVEQGPLKKYNAEKLNCFNKCVHGASISLHASDTTTLQEPTPCKHSATLPI